MRLFWLKISAVIVFSSTILGVHLLYWEEINQTRAARGLNHSFQWTIKVLKLFQAVPDAQVVFAGDSRALMQLNPLQFQAHGIRAINVATASGDLYSFVKLMEELDLHKTPRTYLISVSTFQVNDGASEGAYLGSEQFYDLTLWERLQIYKTRLISQSQGLAKDMRWTPEEFRQGVTAALSTNYTFPMLGFEPSDPRKLEDCSTLRYGTRHTKNVFYKNLKLNGARFRLFKAAIDQLKQWPSKIIIYNGPIHPHFQKCIQNTFAGRAERQFAELVRTAIQGAKNIQFVDFSLRETPDLLETDFADSHHLNEVGAMHFSQMWIGELQKSGI